MLSLWQEAHRLYKIGATSFENVGVGSLANKPIRTGTEVAEMAANFRKNTVVSMPESNLKRDSNNKKMVLAVRLVLDFGVNGRSSTKGK